MLFSANPYMKKEPAAGPSAPGPLLIQRESAMKTTNNQPQAEFLHAELEEARRIIDELTARLQQAEAEVAELRRPPVMKVNQENRIVSSQPELVDVRIIPPPSGARIFALGRGGTIAQTIWNKNDADFFGAWMAYPKIPESVREWLGECWKKP